ncbi:MAG: hypothetical protein M1837_004727 [Sclerophora amabilis]|nr:MAG: hypothetical protein M1837_004727 [Sclerophora amabilis]
MSCLSSFKAFVRRNRKIRHDSQYWRQGGPWYQVAQNADGPRNGVRQLYVADRYLDYYERVEDAIRFQTVDDLDEWFRQAEQNPPTVDSESLTAYRATLGFAPYMRDLRRKGEDEAARPTGSTQGHAVHSSRGPSAHNIASAVPTTHVGSSRISKASSKRSNRFGPGSLSTRQENLRQRLARYEQHRGQRDVAAKVEADHKARSQHISGSDNSEESKPQSATTPESPVRREQQDSATMAEVKKEVRKRFAVKMVEELREELRSSVEEKLREELREELGTEVRAQLREELRPGVAAELYKDEALRQEVGEKLERDFVVAAEEELAAEAQVDEEEEEVEEGKLHGAEGQGEVASNDSGSEEQLKAADEKEDAESAQQCQDSELEPEDEQVPEVGRTQAYASDEGEDVVGGEHQPEREQVDVERGEAEESGPEEAEKPRIETPDEAVMPEEVPSRDTDGALTDLDSERLETKAEPEDGEGHPQVAHADDNGDESPQVQADVISVVTPETPSEAPRVSPRASLGSLEVRKRKRVDDHKDGPAAKKLRVTEDSTAQMQLEEPRPQLAMEGAGDFAAAEEEEQHAEVSVAVVEERQPIPLVPSVSTDGPQYQSQQELPTPTPEARPEPEMLLESDNQQAQEYQQQSVTEYIHEAQQNLGSVNAPEDQSSLQPFQPPFEYTQGSGGELQTESDGRLLEDEPERMAVLEDEQMDDAIEEAPAIEVDLPMTVEETSVPPGHEDAAMGDNDEAMSDNSSEGMDDAPDSAAEGDATMAEPPEVGLYSYADGYESSTYYGPSRSPSLSPPRMVNPVPLQSQGVSGSVSEDFDTMMRRLRDEQANELQRADEFLQEQAKVLAMETDESDSDMSDLSEDGEEEFSSPEMNLAEKQTVVSTVEAPFVEADNGGPTAPPAGENPRRKSEEAEEKERKIRAEEEESKRILDVIEGVLAPAQAAERLRQLSLDQAGLASRDTVKPTAKSSSSPAQKGPKKGLSMFDVPSTVGSLDLGGLSLTEASTASTSAPGEFRPSRLGNIKASLYSEPNVPAPARTLSPSPEPSKKDDDSSSDDSE